ncbi:hypothetical protein ER308_02505 [Egibacter rhizosphaerae]|uniref:Amidohydrolase-related domain-containing protein n=1 Tax=Egibacter rhizosphaerae TaxID=1670831 RepID=A0A411YBG1_9ACTN|nr:amidohydrolase family protein [Egibacter rhizosphaerae]QBI18544.1 hypothetical protein ER308_02505 [Egibacter rhizosphaerae]
MSHPDPEVAENDLVDTHHHLWRCEDVITRGWTASEPRLHQDFGLTQYEPFAREWGIAQSVAVQAADELTENSRLLADVADPHSSPRRVVGWLPLEKPDQTATVLADYGGADLVGVRHLVNFEPDSRWLGRDSVKESLREVARHDLVFEVVPVSADHFELTMQLIRDIPDLRVVVDHLGNPPLQSGANPTWTSGMREFAESGAVDVKVSVGHALLRQGTELDKWELERCVEGVVEMFGAERLLWASNWPVVTLHPQWRSWLSRTLAAIDGLGEDDAHQVRAANARRVYRL